MNDKPLNAPCRRGPVDGFPAALVAALMSSIVVSPAAAQTHGPRVAAWVDPPEVAVGQQFRLVVEVRGAKKVESVLIPRLFEFARCINPYDPAVEVGVGDEEDGVAANSVTLSYVFVSDRGGFFGVRPFRITADGREMETEAVAVLVGRSGVRVEARVEPSRVNVGDEFELIARVMGLEPENPEFIWPDLFDVAERGESCSGGGREYRCRLRARAPGEFVIAPVRVAERDTTYESNPVTLVVTDEPRHVEIEATVESGSIWVGGEFVFRVEVAGTHELDEEPTPPETGDFAEFVGSEEPSLHGGSNGYGITYRHRFRALRPGRFEIGPVRIVAEGRTVGTDPVVVSVDEVPTGAPDPPASLVLTGTAAKSRAYVGEPVIVTYSVAHGGHFRWPRVGTRSRPSLDHVDVLERPGYAGEELNEATWPRNRIGVDRFALLPRRAGRLKVGAVTMEVGVSNSHDVWARTFPGEFDREFTPYVLASNPLTLEVLALPDEGRPASFRGHVGTLELSSRLNGTRVEVGGALTLEVKVKVEGHVEGLPGPEIDFPGAFTVPEPEIRTDLAHYGRSKLRGTRTYIHHLTATTPGRYEIPAVEMSYFDPATESYGTTRSHPLTITVVPAGAEAR